MFANSQITVMLPAPDMSAAVNVRLAVPVASVDTVPVSEAGDDMVTLGSGLMVYFIGMPDTAGEMVTVLTR